VEPFYSEFAAGRFESSPSTAGPWGPSNQHAGPPSALLARAMERHSPRENHRLARVAIDILSPVPVQPLTIEVETIRRGKRTELLQASAVAQGKVVMIARAWRMPATASDFPTVSTDDFPKRTLEPPAPQEISMPYAYTGGYMSAIDWSFEEGGFHTPGPGRAWARPNVPLIAGEKLTPWQRTLIVADSASGVSLSLDPLQYIAINCDIAVTLFRDPRDDWILLDAETTAAPQGGAMTAARLYDLQGPVGVSVQSLFATATSPAEHRDDFTGK
jgi:acyl-Coa thioesterase superfamily protein/acyl-CoA thioesterase superfamily protein